MIEINVVPEHLQQKRRTRKARFSKIHIPKEAIIGLVGGLVAFLFIVHIILQVLIFMKFGQRAGYTRQLKEIAAYKEEIDGLKQKLRAFQGKRTAIEKVTTGERLSWSRKLNSISDALPRGVWLTKISVDGKTFLIEGSAVSKEHEEMISVGNFVSSLKQQPYFMEGLMSLEVGSMQRQKIRNVEVADFLIRARLK